MAPGGRLSHELATVNHSRELKEEEHAPSSPFNSRSYQKECLLLLSIKLTPVLQLALISRHRNMPRIINE